MVPVPAGQLEVQLIRVASASPSFNQIAVLDAPDAPHGSSISLLLLDDSGAQTALANGQH